MHVPKSAGTSLHNALIAALKPERVAVGLGRHHFGGFQDFETMPEESAAMLLLTPESMRQDAEYIGGHIAYPDIRTRFPDAQVITMVREPYCRTISQWLFWRSWPWGDRDFWGQWGRIIDHSRQPLKVFLSEPEAAPVTDNPLTRLLIGSDDVVPLNSFIPDEAHSLLLEKALHNLRLFSYVGYVEDPKSHEKLSEWLGKRLVVNRENETPELASHLRGNMACELDPETLKLLMDRNAIDLSLWSQVVAWHDANGNDVRLSTLCRALPRFAALLGGWSSDAAS